MANTFILIHKSCCLLHLFQVRYAYLQSRSIQSHYRATSIVAFTSGSIVTDFIVTFDLQANVTMEDVQLILESAVTEDQYLLTGAAGLGNLTIDPDSIYFSG